MNTPTFTSLSLDRRPNGRVILWLDLPGRSLNAISRQMLAELDAVFDSIAGDSSVRLLVIASRKHSSFLAGADLHEFVSVTSSEQAAALSQTGQNAFQKLALLRCPTVAVIRGYCLGGGLELAMACDYRVAINQPGTQFGLPEIELGLLPGWGGTQRLPKIVGLERAVLIILMRHRLDPLIAERWHLVDAVFPTQEQALQNLDASLGERWIADGKRPATRLPIRTWRQRLLEGNPLGRALLFRGVDRAMRRLVPDDMPSPWEAFRALRTGIEQGMPAGLQAERDGIGKLSQTKACRNMIALFFRIEEARKGEDSGESAAATTTDARPSQCLGVVGAGTMGAGIAQLAAMKGFRVIVQEVNEPALQAGVWRIQDLFAKAVAKRLITADDARTRLARVEATTTWKNFDQTTAVIEAVLEELPVKRKVFAELEQRTSPTTVLATNTSSILVADIQSEAHHPERVGGLHFFNPVHKMPLVEVVAAPRTAPSTAQALARLAAALGKTPVVLNDSPGFIVNRILMPYLNEAGMLVADGLAVDHIDRMMRRFGMPMGPLELLDQVGLDIAAHAAESLRPLFKDSLSPHPALAWLCDHGCLGQKTGQGFYRYAGKKKTVNREMLDRLRSQFSAQTSAAAHADLQMGDWPRERMVSLMVNEAARCLESGVADRPDTIDLAMILGTGWAPHRGGPLRYADDRGVADLVQTMDDLDRKLGPRFAPCELLRQRAASHVPFYSAERELHPV